MTDEPLLSNIAEFTVSELTQTIKRHLEGEFPKVRVKGEISGTKYYPSGHCYFSLKDASAVVNGVCWQGIVSKLTCRPEDGLEVIITGRITIGNRSQYQLIVEHIELAGIGAILKMIEDRRRKLETEGLFDKSRKKPLPFIPSVIGVVTSPAGAVIRDILHRLRERFPCHVIVWPTAVQGQGAAEQIAAAIEGFNRTSLIFPRPDLIIVARGGGSIEDLMPFNEEIVVRAAAVSQIPLISAVGHETDWTLIDHAADLRAPTPTGAAEMAVPVRADLLNMLRGEESRLHQNMKVAIERRGQSLLREGRALGDPKRLLEWAMQGLDQWGERWLRLSHRFFEDKTHEVARLAAKIRGPREQILMAENKIQQNAEKLASYWRQIRLEKSHELERWAQLLQSYSYQHVLERGFALVRNNKGEPVIRAGDVKPGAKLNLQFQDGQAEVTAQPIQEKLL